MSIARQYLTRPITVSILQPVIIATVVLLTACESRWEKIPDDELAAKASECASMSNPAPAMIQVCKNYQRECERRRANNIYAC